MEAKELMICDWVRNKKTCNIFQWSSEDYTESITENIDPIPLTTEILEANGFMYLMNHSFYNERLPFDIKTCKEKDNKDYEVGQEGDITYYCCYVHTLQHLLRDFDLDAWADNFKIK